MMTEHEQALFSGEHDTTWNKRRVFTSKRILLLEIDEFSPQLDLERW